MAREEKEKKNTLQGCVHGLRVLLCEKERGRHTQESIMWYVSSLSTQCGGEPQGAEDGHQRTKKIRIEWKSGETHTNTRAALHKHTRNN